MASGLLWCGIGGGGGGGVVERRGAEKKLVSSVTFTGSAYF